MSSNPDSGDKPYTFSDSGGRPGIDAYNTNYTFRPLDRVWLRDPATKARLGLYTVSSVQNGNYILVDDNSIPLRNGAEIRESELELYEEFE